MLKNEIERYLATRSGKVAVVWRDLISGEEFSIAGKTRFVSASTIKLLIMAELLDQIAAGRRSLSDHILLTQAWVTGGDGILKELRPGHSFALEEILTLMIIVSDNTATNLLIDLLEMDAINEQAKKLGLRETQLGRKMMDTEAKRQGRENYICAEDMAKMLELIYRGTLVDEKMSRTALEILLRQQQTGRLQLYLPEETPVAHKCGDLDCLEHDGGLILVEGHPYLLVVLTEQNQSNREGRETIGAISKMVYDAMLVR